MNFRAFSRPDDEYISSINGTFSSDTSEKSMKIYGFSNFLVLKVAYEERLVDDFVGVIVIFNHVRCVP